jgi:hypothetical protein
LIFLIRCIYPLNLFDEAPNLWDFTVNGDVLRVVDCTTMGSLDEKTYRYQSINACYLAKRLHFSLRLSTHGLAALYAIDLGNCKSIHSRERIKSRSLLKCSADRPRPNYDQRKRHRAPDSDICVLTFVDLETSVYSDISSPLNAISAVRIFCIIPTPPMKFLFHQLLLPRLPISVL